MVNAPLIRSLMNAPWIWSHIGDVAPNISPPFRLRQRTHSGYPVGAPPAG